MATRRLGKGLSALIPDIQASTEESGNKNLSEISVSQIAPNPFQPRVDFEPGALDDLKKSISANGLITPVTVRRQDSGFQLIAGERRLRAVQELGYDQVPAYILKVETDEEMLELALVENIQRENLNPIEESLGYQRLINECKLTQDEVARKVGRDRATIANFLRLLNLPKQVQDSLRDGKIAAGHARALLACKSEIDLMVLWRKTIDDSLSVRQVEAFAKAEKTTSVRKKAAKEKNASPEVLQAEDELRQIFGTQVHIVAGRVGGKLEIEYYSDSDFERVLELLYRLS